jgi:hypothetical protein
MYFGETLQSVARAGDKPVVTVRTTLRSCCRRIPALLREVDRPHVGGLDRTL